jgi:hypothetical protein
MSVEQAMSLGATPIRSGRVLFGGTLVGLLVWPILSAIMWFIVPESMWHEPNLPEIWFEFLIISGLLSGALSLLLARQRRFVHMLLMMAISGPVAFAVVFVLALVTHR